MCKSFLKKTAAVIAVSIAAFAANAQANAGLTGNTGIGIAALFPGDVGIGDHPDVIRADNFEGYSVWRDLTAGGWGVTNGENPAPEGTHVLFSSENKVTGTQSLQLDLFARNSPRHTGISLDLDQTQQQDLIFVRYYHKICTTYHVPPGISNHNGTSVSSRYWSSGPAHMGPGKAADGTNKFLIQLENSAAAGYDGYSMKAYIYHPEQRYNYEGSVPIPGMSARSPGEPWRADGNYRAGEQYGDAFYPDGEVMPWNHWRGDYGPEFVPLPKFFVELGRWYCYELMIKANTPGERDGRITAWIDGEVIMDFPNMRLRDINDLKIDQVGFTFGSNVIPVKTSAWYDNIVIATSYIGPINFTDAPIAPPPPPQTDPQGSFRVLLTVRESIGDAANPPFRGAPITITGDGTYTAKVYTMEYDSFTGLALESEAFVPAGWEDAVITFDEVIVRGVPAPETKQGIVTLIDVSLGNTRGATPLLNRDGSVNAQLWNGWQSSTQNHLTDTATVAPRRGHIGFGAPGISMITAIEVTFTVTGSPVTSILSPDRVIPNVGGNKDIGVENFQPVQALSFTAGPNPVTKSSGMVNFFAGAPLAGALYAAPIRGTLTIYNASGNIVNKIRVTDDINRGGAINRTRTDDADEPRRIIGSWDLTDRKSRPVSEGTYLVKGTITTSDGKKERVSMMVGVR